MRPRQQRYCIYWDFLLRLQIHLCVAAALVVFALCLHAVEGGRLYAFSAAALSNPLSAHRTIVAPIRRPPLDIAIRPLDRPIEPKLRRRGVQLCLLHGPRLSRLLSLADIPLGLVTLMKMVVQWWDSTGAAAGGGNSSSAAIAETKSRDHVIVSSGWWSCQAGRVEGGGSGTRDELSALHSALREQAPSIGPIQLVQCK